MPRRAVFFDPDGTLCERTGPVVEPQQVRLLPHAADTVRRLNRDNWQVIVVTERPAVAFGEFDEDVLAEIHERMRLLLLDDGARLDGIYHCPHHPEAPLERYRAECACRRPGVALFERARDEMGIDLAGSFLVCDTLFALRGAAALGIRALLVRTEEGRETEDRMDRAGLDPVTVVDGIEAAVDLVLQDGAPAGAAAS